MTKRAKQNAPWWLAMVFAVLVALGGHSQRVPQPWGLLLELGGIAGAAAAGVMVRRQP